MLPFGKNTMAMAHPHFTAKRASVLPKTGQVTPYPTGDDGDVKAGKAHQFQQVGNLVYDWSTMLCWVLNPAMIIPGGTGKDGDLNPIAGGWVSGIDYHIGDLVQYSVDSKYYICILDHTAGSILPTNTTYWVPTPWATISSGSIVPATMAWADAVANSLMTYAGIGPWSVSNPLGWRLPNVNEIGSLRQFGIGWPSIVEPFMSNSNIQKANYWTSTTYRSNINCAWISNFDIGVQTNNTAKTVGCYVLPVRSLIV